MPPEVVPGSTRFAVPSDSHGKEHQPASHAGAVVARRRLSRRALVAAGLAVFALVAGIAVAVAAQRGDDGGSASTDTTAAATVPAVAVSTLPPSTAPTTTAAPTTTVADVVVLTTGTLQAVFTQQASRDGSTAGFTRTDDVVLTVECRPSGCVLKGYELAEADGGFARRTDDPVPGTNPACAPIHNTVDLTVPERQVVGGLSVPSRLVGLIERRWDSGFLQSGPNSYECVGFSSVLDVDAILFPA